MTDTTAFPPESLPIIVAVDETPAELAALHWGARQARLQGCLMRVVNCWEPGPGQVAALSGREHERMREAVERTRRASIEEAVGEIAPDVKTRIEIVEGPTGPVLVEMARDASLLVLAAHIHPGRRRLTADSVGHYCLSYSSCPVVMVPGKPPGGGRVRGRTQ